MFKFVLGLTFFSLLVCVLPNPYVYILCVLIYIGILCVCTWSNSVKLRWWVRQTVYVLPCIWASLLFFFSQERIEETYIHTWVVVSGYRPGSFIMKNSANKSILVYSDDSFTIWSELQVVWNLIPAHRFSLENDALDFSTISFNFEFEKWLLHKWFSWAIYAQGIEVIWVGDPWYITLLRKRVLEYVIHTYSNSNTTWLLLWLYIGDVSLLSEEVYDSFIASGLVHIVAVSGSNIYMLVLFLSVILFFLPYYTRLWVISIIILLYCLLCGLDSSVFRALLMWYLIFASCVLGRSLSIYRSLTYAYVVLLTLYPYSLLFDMWFLLSFCAVLWIVLCSKLYTRVFSDTLTGILRYIHIYALPSVWATLWVVGPLIFYMGTVNLTSMVSNLLLIPLLPIVFLLSSIVWLLPVWQVQSWLVLSVDTFLGSIVRISSGSLDYSFMVSYTTIYWHRLLLACWVFFWLCVYVYIQSTHMSR
jgi:ComEC/Rec2-related protein